MKSCRTVVLEEFVVRRSSFFVDRFHSVCPSVCWFFFGSDSAIDFMEQRFHEILKLKIRDGRICESLALIHLRIMIQVKEPFRGC